MELFPSSREYFGWAFPVPGHFFPVPGNWERIRVLWGYFIGMLLFGLASAVVPGNCFLVPRSHLPVPMNHFLVPRNHLPVPKNQGEEFPGRGSLQSWANLDLSLILDHFLEA